MSTTEPMSIHKALCELKVIGDRIEKSMGKIPFVLANEHANRKIQGIPVEEFVTQINILKKSEHLKSLNNLRGKAVPYPVHGKGNRKKRK